MTRLEQVDYDPFASMPAPALAPTPVPGGGGMTRLEAVDYDPFAPKPAGPATPKELSSGSRGLLGNVAAPFTDYPSTYAGMVRESTGQLGEGAQRIGRALTPMDGRPRVGPFPGGKANLVAGLGETALGAAGYVTSPINAAIRTTVGLPVERITGVPKEYPELAASLALPIPKRIPGIGGAAKRPVAPSAEQLFEASDDAYAAARASPFRLQPHETKQLADEITTGLKAEGYRAANVPKTFNAIENEFKLNAASDVADLDAVRKVLNKARKDPGEADAARRAIEAIDARLSAQVPEIAQARADWAAGSRSETITEAMEKAARAAGPDTRISEKVANQMRAIRNSPRLRRGFSENELEMMDTIAKGGGPIAKMAGKLGTGLGGNLGAWGFITGAQTLGAAPALGYGLKKIGNTIAARDVAKLDEAVRSRSALGQAVGTSFTQWAKTAQAYEAAPSVKGFIRASIASRDLANTARGAGFQFTEQDLMRALAAEKTQPE